MLYCNQLGRDDLKIFLIGPVRWVKTGPPQTQAELTYLVLAFEVWINPPKETEMPSANSVQ